MQRFSRVITSINALESEFLVFHATTDDAFPAYFDKYDKSRHINHIRYKITKGISLQRLLNFYF